MEVCPRTNPFRTARMLTRHSAMRNVGLSASRARVIPVSDIESRPPNRNAGCAMGEMVKSFPSDGPRGDAPGRELAGEAKEAASRAAERAKGIVESRVTERAGRSAEEIDDVARALRNTRQQLSGNFAAPYVD